MTNTSAIILMGGAGSRFGSATPKQFHRLAGKSIYLHTLEAFTSSDLFDQIILVCHPDWIEKVRGETQEKFMVVPGGATRQASAFAGLQACDLQTQTVVIHDAVRPLVSQEVLRQNVEKAKLYGAVDTCIPSSDTIVCSSSGKQIDSIPDRSCYLRGQTPQSFSYSLILEAHKKALAEKIANATDDCQLIIRLGRPVHIVLGDESNLKITNEYDLLLAEHLLRLKQCSIKDRFEHSLFGKTYVIAGGNGGIGKKICEKLGKEGAIALPVSRRSLPYAADLCRSDSVEKIFETIHGTHGPLDGLVNCLGLFRINDLEKTTYSEIEALIATNLTSFIFSCKAARIKPGGHLVNVSSSAYTRGRKSMAVYASAKAAVVNFTQGLAEERPELCVNVIAPSRTDTAMRRSQFPDELKSDLLSPDVIAQAVIDLLKQSEITGTIIEVRPSH